MPPSRQRVSRVAPCQVGRLAQDSPCPLAWRLSMQGHRAQTGIKPQALERRNNSVSSEFRAGTRGPQRKDTARTPFRSASYGDRQGSDSANR